MGIDIHRGMVAWCRANLTAVDPAFEFWHHDVFAAGLNPAGENNVLAFPASNDEFTLVQAYSIFPHLVEAHAVHYLNEAARVLRPVGYLHSTWFLFEKRYFPMMQDFQNALFINDRESGADEVELPADEAPFGRHPPPPLRPGAALLGLGGG